MNQNDFRRHNKTLPLKNCFFLLRNLRIRKKDFGILL